MARKADSSAGAAPDGSIRRTMRILAELCHHGPLTLTQLAGRLELSPSTVSRFLGILRDDGLVEQRDDRRWRATLEMWRLGLAAFESGGWASNGVDDILRRVTDATGETAVHIVYDRGWVTYVAESTSPHSIRTHVGIGTRYRAADVTSGRLLLAYQPADEVERVMVEFWGSARWASERDGFLAVLAEIRRNGYSFGTSAVWDGIWGLSVPVADRAGGVRASVGISAPESRHPGSLDAYVAALQEAAQLLARSTRQFD